MRRCIVLVVCLSMLLGLAAAAGSAAAAKAKLVWQVHWSDFQVEGVYSGEGANRKLVSKGLRQYVEEYMKLHPDVEIEIQSVPMEEYLQKVLVARSSGVAPDLYGIYSLWGVQLVQNGILDGPPNAVVKDVRENYTPVAVAGATIDGKIWGIPMEVGNYCLVYNKELLKAKGFTSPPKTWNELVDMASKLTVRDKSGVITQYGFAFLAGWESAVVHPYLGLLWDLGGDFLSPDFKKCVVNSPEGVQALEAELQLFKTGGTDPAGSVWSFPQGKVAMMIMASWYEQSLKQGLGDKYDKVVGVAPVPYIKKPVNAGYTWFLAVDSASKNKKAAWDFLMWFTAETQKPKNTTRLGDLMVETIGSLPCREIDLANHPDTLNDLYTKTFVEQLKNSKPEPNVAQGAEVKTILANEIVEAWHGRKSAKQALDDAVLKINEILAEFY
ncbi:MAG: ABC transporter substrate-binding protein [Bacteroidota bacterium]